MSADPNGFLLIRAAPALKSWASPALDEFALQWFNAANGRALSQQCSKQSRMNNFASNKKLTEQKLSVMDPEPSIWLTTLHTFLLGYRCKSIFEVSQIPRQTGFVLSPNRLI
jgi:hypothetical protein